MTVKVPFDAKQIRYGLDKLEVSTDTPKVVPSTRLYWSVVGHVKRYAKATGKKFKVRLLDGTIHIWRLK
jgi:hypothetical protein